jgi:hypothetical protein
MIAQLASLSFCASVWLIVIERLRVPGALLPALIVGCVATGIVLIFQLRCRRSSNELARGR